MNSNELNSNYRVPREVFAYFHITETKEFFMNEKLLFPRRKGNLIRILTRGNEGKAGIFIFKLLEFPRRAWSAYCQRQK